MRQEHTVLAEGELVDAADDEDVFAICVVGTEADPGVASENVVVGIAQRLRPGVVRVELKAVGEALVELGLQGVVTRIGGGRGRCHAIAAADRRRTVVG